MKIHLKQSVVILGLVLSAHLAALPSSWAGTPDEAFCVQAEGSATAHPEVLVLGELAAQFCPGGNPVSSLNTTLGWRQAFELLDNAHDSIFDASSRAPRGSEGRTAFTNLLSTALANFLEAEAQAMANGEVPDLN